MQEEINFPGLTAIDLAIFDLSGKLSNTPCHEMLKIECKTSPLLTYTITYEEDESILLEKINDAKSFKKLKLELGTKHDIHFIVFVLKNSDKPFFADANQGLKTLQEAVYMAEFLKEINCLFIE